MIWPSRNSHHFLFGYLHTSKTRPAILLHCPGSGALCSRPLSLITPAISSVMLPQACVPPCNSSYELVTFHRAKRKRSNVRCDVGVWTGVVLSVEDAEVGAGGSWDFRLTDIYHLFPYTINVA